MAVKINKVFLESLSEEKLLEVIAVVNGVDTLPETKKVITDPNPGKEMLAIAFKKAVDSIPGDDDVVVSKVNQDVIDVYSGLIKKEPAPVAPEGDKPKRKKKEKTEGENGEKKEKVVKEGNLLSLVRDLMGQGLNCEEIYAKTVPFLQNHRPDFFKNLGEKKFNTWARKHTASSMWVVDPKFPRTMRGKKAE